ncbi:MAG TPA: DegV family protein [Candidatus Solibacter sp.]|jgi:DegV family protein with EDD domain|nr:DegV family protein [Candidatus Solibacter sp.]
MTRIVVDSTCDLPESRMRELGIEMVPLQVHFGDEAFRDKIDLDEDAFFKRLEKATQLPTTSQPSPGDFEEVYGRIPEGEPIVSIHIAHQLSGTIQSAKLAADAMPGREIHIIDSGNTTWAAGLLALEAAEAVQAGKDLNEVITHVEGLVPRVRLLAVLDTLKYVVMGGRVSRVQGAIGGLLRVKPMLLLVDGVIERMPPARTWGQAGQKIVQDIEAHGGADRIAVIHAKAPEAGQTMKKTLEDSLGVDGILEGTIGPVIGTHSGPGAVGVAYIAKQAG